MAALFTTVGFIELIALVSGIAYIICGHYRTNVSWCFGMVSALCIIYVDVVKTQLYFDALLHVFFFAMSSLGMYLWWKGSKTKKVLRISRMSISSYLVYIFISILIALAAGYLMDSQSEANYPYLDCFRMMMSIFATFLIIYCVINAWSYWILVDIISVILYSLTGAFMLAILYGGYMLSNALMWRKWRADYNRRN